MSDVGDKAADGTADDQVAAATPATAKDAPPAAPPPAAGEPPATGGSEATDERAELEQLRAEVAELRNHPPAARRRHRGGWRAPVAVVLIVLGCVLAPVSVLAVWTANQVSDTNRYVQNVAPLIHDPAVQSALTDKISTEINTRLNVQGLTNQAADALTSRGLTRVGTLLHTFSGQIAGAVSGFIHGQVAKIVASPQVASLWVAGEPDGACPTGQGAVRPGQRVRHDQQRPGRAEPGPVHRPGQAAPGRPWAHAS